MTEPIKIREFLASARDWRVVSDGAVAFYRSESLAGSASFVSALADVPNFAEHQFGIDVRRDGVSVRVVTLREDMMGLTDRDLELAQRISETARAHGLSADPSQVQSLLIVPGAPHRRDVMPFWQAVMGYVPRPDSPDEDLIDPHDRGVALWFEEMEEARPGGLGAIHVAVWLGIDEAPARVEAALAAGGTLVRDDYAPAWWTLADKYGNEVDVATVAYRDEPPPEAQD
jgi:4a-hydroxytetrahydrobiopterin dehydratase